MDFVCTSCFGWEYLYEQIIRSIAGNGVVIRYYRIMNGIAISPRDLICHSDISTEASLQIILFDWSKNHQKKSLKALSFMPIDSSILGRSDL